jgi:hypothetical protein
MSGNEGAVSRHKLRCSNIVRRCKNVDPADAARCQFVGTTEELMEHAACCRLREVAPCKLCGDCLAHYETHQCSPDRQGEAERLYETCMAGAGEDTTQLRLQVAGGMWRTRRDADLATRFLESALRLEWEDDFASDDIGSWLARTVAEVIVANDGRCDSIWFFSVTYMKHSLDADHLTALRRTVSSVPASAWRFDSFAPRYAAALMESHRSAGSKPLDITLRVMLRDMLASDDAQGMAECIQGRRLSYKQADSIVSLLCRYPPARVAHVMDVLTHPAVCGVLRRRTLRNAAGALWVAQCLATHQANLSAAQRTLAAGWVADIDKLCIRSESAARLLRGVHRRLVLDP